MAIRVGRWDCKYCGHVGNLGPHKHCVNCGSGRDHDLKFYLPKDAKIVSDEEELKRATSGSDWICENCNTGNFNKSKFCSNCGAPPSGEFLEEKTYDLEDIPIDSQKETQEDHVEEYNKKHGLLKRTFQKAKLWFYGIIAAFTAFLASFSTTVQMEIVSLDWVRKVELQEFKWVQEGGWYKPQNTRNASSKQEVHHYNKVYKGTETKTRTVQVQVGSEQYVCGSKDMGNGYFQDVYCTRPIYESRQETYTEEVYDDVPVYQPYFTYEIERWVKIEEMRAAGNDRPATWPTDNRIDNVRYRAGPKTESYEVIVERKGKQHKHPASFAKWNQLEIGQYLEAEISTVYRYYKGLKIKLL